MRRGKKKDYSLRGKNKPNSECNSHNGSLLEVNEKRWGYFSSKITITIQAKLSYIGFILILIVLIFLGLLRLYTVKLIDFGKHIHTRTLTYIHVFRV